MLNYKRNWFDKAFWPVSMVLIMILFFLVFMLPVIQEHDLHKIQTYTETSKPDTSQEK